MATKSWNEAREAQLVSAVEGVEIVSQDMLKEIAADMETTPRSIGSKLRKMGYEVEKATGAKSSWTDAEQEALVEFLTANSGAFTYAEIASAVVDGKFSAKQVQGKVLSLELTEHVKPTPKVEAQRSYSEAEEAQIVELVEGGISIEALAEAMNRPVNAVRGKCLSLLKEKRIEAIPTQEHSTAKAKADVLDGIDVANLTVAEIAEAASRTERGIKAILTRRGLTCADYDGAARQEKLAAKKAD
ncbi:D5 protein [Vibrio phage VCPH]|nr:D5 protein [Vibrio phage VCPH]